MKKRWVQILCVLLWTSFMTGCLYPNSSRSDNQRAGLEYLAVVQSAVDQYYKETGVLPIKNFDHQTPLFERYIVDFVKLLNSPFLSQIPPNAFEKGGSHYYVLVHVEEEPAVKLYDLSVAQQVNDIQRAVDQYRLQHGSLPLNDAYTPNWYTIDYARLSMKEQVVRSMYSGGSLGLLINEQGQVCVDYGQDIAVLIRRESIEPAEDMDLRHLLVQHSPYVPVKSQPYYWVDGDPLLQ